MLKFSVFLNHTYLQIFEINNLAYFMNINVHQQNEYYFKVMLDYNWLCFIKTMRKWLLLVNKIQLTSTLQKVTINNLCSGWTDLSININKQTEQQWPQSQPFISICLPCLLVLLKGVWEKWWYSLLVFQSVLLSQTVQYLEQSD